MSSAMLFYLLIVVFVLLNVLDAHSTLKVISRTSYRNEKNPVARLLFKLLGPVAGVIILKAILVPVIFLMFYLFHFSTFDMNLVLGIANVFYLAVVLHNYNVVRRIDKFRQKLDEYEDTDDQKAGS